MKPRVSIVLTIVCVAFAALLVVQWRQLNDERALRQKLQLQVENMQGEIQSSQARLAQAETARASLQAQFDTMALDLASGRSTTPAASSTSSQDTPQANPSAKTPAPTQGNTGPANPMAMMSEMLKDPEMRKAFEQQQQFALDMMYEPLFEKLELTPEEKDAFKKVLLEQHMSNMEQATSLMDQGNTNRMAIAEEMAAEKARRDEEMKAIIGEDRYQQVEDYTLTMGERMMLNQQMKLPPEQMDQLMAIIAEEKRAVQMAQLPGMDPAQNPQLFLEEGFMEQQMAQQETVNAHVYERARALLSPEQLKKFDEFQRSQKAMQEAAMKMAQKMMKPDAGLAPAPPVPTQQ